MSRRATVVVLALLAACSAPEESVAREVERVPERPAEPAVRTPLVRGFVHDAAGKPALALVTVVHRRGSSAGDTRANGSFEVERPDLGDFVLRATTGDGRAAILPMRAGEDDARLVLAPGWTLDVIVRGSREVRCAVFQGEKRVADVAVGSKRPARLVLLPGVVQVRLYDGDRVLLERRLEARAGNLLDVQYDVAD